MKSGWLGGAIWLMAAAAGAAPPATSPLPVTKPLPLVSPLVASVSRGALTRSLRPRLRQTGLPVVAESGVAVMASRVPPIRSGKPVDLIPVSVRIPSSQPAPKAGIKGEICGDPALTGQLIAPIAAAAPGCGLDSGVKVTSVAGIRLSQPATIDCQTAVALKTWVKAAVIPAFGSRGGGLASLDVADSYACRPRNNQSGNKMSEHGMGHAIDIAGFKLANGQEVTVLDAWGTLRFGSALKVARRAACGPFTTVLGPGSDPYHRNHFHLDTARGRNPYCH